MLGNPGILAGWVLGGSALAIGVRFFDPPVFYVHFYPCIPLLIVLFFGSRSFSVVKFLFLLLVVNFCCY